MIDSFKTLIVSTLVQTFTDRFECNVECLFFTSYLYSSRHIWLLDTGFTFWHFRRSYRQFMIRQLFIYTMKETPLRMTP